MAEREKLIEIKDLQITFGSGRKKFVAVDHVNFDIYKGETFSLVGEVRFRKDYHRTGHHPDQSCIRRRDPLPGTAHQRKDLQRLRPSSGKILSDDLPGSDGFFK